MVSLLKYSNSDLDQKGMFFEFFQELWEIAALAQSMRLLSLKFCKDITADVMFLPNYSTNDLDRRSRSRGHLSSKHKD